MNNDSGSSCSSSDEFLNENPKRLVNSPVKVISKFSSFVRYPVNEMMKGADATFGAPTWSKRSLLSKDEIKEANELLKSVSRRV